MFNESGVWGSVSDTEVGVLTLAINATSLQFDKLVVSANFAELPCCR